MSEHDVTARVRYLVPGEAKPVYWASRPGSDAAMNIAAEFEERDVLVQDARLASTAPVLDRQGFELRAHNSAVADFYAVPESAGKYENELIELVQAVTGAEEALVFDHTLRSDSPRVRGERTTREPASVIHNDYTDASARKRLHDLLPQRALQLAARRFAIINAWRSVAGPVENSPMTCCDAATLNADDLVASERRAVDRVGELELVTFNPAHRWYYYPRMTRDEVLLLKTFDSATDGRARRSIHTAFDNPAAAPDAPPRESIESRLLVFF